MRVADRDNAALARIRASIARTDRADVRERVLLVLAHERVKRGRGEGPGRETVSGLPRVERARADEAQRYAQLVPRVQALVARVLPENARVLVVSRGDDALLELQGRAAGHFPQADGKWAGFYPRDGEDAVTHLVDLVTAGWQFIVFPATAFWWLEYYERLASRLLAHGRTIWHDADCAIFALESALGEPW